jgi:glucuronate isomerase
MLYSQGVTLEQFGVARIDGGETERDARRIWGLFAQHYHLFRGTPTRMWFDWVLANVFELPVPLTPANADKAYDTIAEKLQQDSFRPRALFDRFNIEALATTESPLDDLRHHIAIRKSGWSGRVITAYRPDPAVDPDALGFKENLQQFAEISKEDALTWKGYLAAHRKRREFFASMGATSTDHGHPTARTEDLSASDAQALFDRIVRGAAQPGDAERFRGQMLTEMARMSLDDGLVLQIHPGSCRNHNPILFERFGPNIGADIPTATSYVDALKPLLNRFGNDPKLSIIVFTLDETSYSRELAPLAGHYPAMKLGPSWWFHDSPEGMMRFREQTTETAGFYNTVGFNDDTRAFLSIPARHDVARRIDCAFLARLVTEHRLPEDEAAQVAADLAYALPKRAYKL